jgi:hypothetical protein
MIELKILVPAGIRRGRDPYVKYPLTVPIYTQKFIRKLYFSNILVY